jgi:hypothetical protein
VNTPTTPYSRRRTRPDRGAPAARGSHRPGPRPRPRPSPQHRPGAEDGRRGRSSGRRCPPRSPPSRTSFVVVVDAAPRQPGVWLAAWESNGATPGKHALGLRVRSPREECTGWRACLGPQRVAFMPRTGSAQFDEQPHACEKRTRLRLTDHRLETSARTGAAPESTNSDHDELMGDNAPVTVLLRGTTYRGLIVANRRQGSHRRMRSCDSPLHQFGRSYGPQWMTCGDT